jgi:large subunit ribosomal protein L16
MFELAGVREDIAVEALRRAAHKLPVACRIVKRDQIGMAAAEEAHAEADDAVEVIDVAESEAEVVQA